MLKFKSKGILVAASECHNLGERNRINLTFENQNFEGVLDGGHNMLACGLHILGIIGISEEKRRSIKKWDQFESLWKDCFKEESFSYIDDKINSNIDNPELNALLPLEIVYPTESGHSVFEQNIYYISDARNNNTALTLQTKSNHKGHYEIIKESLDELVNKKVMWKDNEEVQGKNPIKSQDVIALSLIPLIALQRIGKLPESLDKINPVVLYSSKAKCVQIFDNLIDTITPRNDEDVEATAEQKYEALLANDLLVSAFSLLIDLPSLDDFIYTNFAKFYNKTGKRFANCPKVKKYNPKEKGANFTNRKKITTYYNQESEYNFPIGFYTPIVASLHALMKIDGDKLSWAVKDPKKFLQDNLSKVMEGYVEMMDDFNSDPQTIGKSSSIYRYVEREFLYLLPKE